MSDVFTYQGVRIDSDKRTVHFDFSLSYAGKVYELSERLVFPVPLLETDVQRACLRTLHLALGISYYKIFLPQHIEHPYTMTMDEADFWNTVWRNGLGEFLYINKLAPERLAKFGPHEGSVLQPGASAPGARRTALLGIGGGKDSIVAGEMLKQASIDLEGFVMATGEQLGQAKAVADTMNIRLHVVERTLDPQLLSLQEQPEAYKGHVPISLIFGLVGTTLAAALDSAYVVVANEASASIPRHTADFGVVNHQWSKSFNFEQKLQAFIREHISPGITYFSAIRQLSSVAIAKLFASYPQYFEVFTSDNYVFRIDPSKRPNARWSLESPKSLSSFILLAPWLSEADMLRTFGRDFLNEDSLQTLFLELLGRQGEQPLDCVGTTDELVLSLNLAAGQNKFADSSLMRLAVEQGIIMESDWQSALEPMLQLKSEQALPEAVRQLIEDKLRAELSA